MDLFKGLGSNFRNQVDNDKCRMSGGTRLWERVGGRWEEQLRFS